MNPIKRGLLALAAVLIVGTIAVLILNKKDPAPNMAWTALDGQTYQLQDFKGKVVLVNFWATDCATCVKEMPMFTETYHTYHDQGFDIVAIALAHDNPVYIQNFVRDRSLPFNVGHDADGSRAQLFNGIQATPTSFLIDKQGNIVKRYLGEPNHAEFISAIEKALAQ